MNKDEKHLWQDSKGVIHSCEMTKVSNLRDAPVLVWTKCERDVPANKSFSSNEVPTCDKCLDDKS